MTDRDQLEALGFACTDRPALSVDVGRRWFAAEKIWEGDPGEAPPPERYEILAEAVDGAIDEEAAWAALLALAGG